MRAREEGRGHTSEREVEGKTLLAEAGVEMLNYAEVGVVSVLVVYGSYVKLPARNHDEVQVWNCKGSLIEEFQVYIVYDNIAIRFLKSTAVHSPFGQVLVG